MEENKSEFKSETIPVSFKANELEQKILEYLKKRAQLIGVSSYIKQLIYEDMIKNNPNQ